HAEYATGYRHTSSTLTTTLLLLLLYYFPAPPTTEAYTLSLHDALPISFRATRRPSNVVYDPIRLVPPATPPAPKPTLALVGIVRSEEHTSELQSHLNLVCRILLEKKNNNITNDIQ